MDVVNSETLRVPFLSKGRPYINMVYTPQQLVEAMEKGEKPSSMLDYYHTKCVESVKAGNDTALSYWTKCVNYLKFKYNLNEGENMAK